MGEQLGQFYNDGAGDNSFAEAIAKQAREAEEAEKAKTAAAEAARRAAEEAARLAVEAETARRLAEQEAAEARRAAEAERAKAEAAEAARAREEAKARADEAERQAAMAEKIAEEYRQKAREARTEASEMIGKTSDNSVMDGSVKTLSEMTSEDINNVAHCNVEASKKKHTSRFKNSLEVAFVLLLCGITLAVQAITGAGLFKKTIKPSSMAIDTMAVPLADPDSLISVEGDDMGILPVTDNDMTPVTVDSVYNYTSIGTAAATVAEQFAALGETIRIEPNLSAFDPSVKFNGYTVIPVRPITWVDGIYSVTLCGVTGEQSKPYLYYDIRINDPDQAAKITSVDLYSFVLAPDEYITDRFSYATDHNQFCVKDEDDPGLFHVFSDMPPAWVSYGDDFVHDITRLQLHFGDVRTSVAVNMCSVLNIDPGLFKDTVSLFSSPTVVKTYKDKSWYSCSLDFKQSSTDCCMHLNALGDPETAFSNKAWLEFVTDIRLIVNDTAYSASIGSANHFYFDEEGAPYTWVYFPAIDVQRGDVVYLQLGDQQMSFDTEWIR